MTIQRKAALHGCYNNGNFGDLLLAEIVQHRLQRALGWKVLVPSRDCNGRVAVLFRIAQSDMLLFGGGGYFTDRESITGLVALTKYFIAAFIMKLLRKPSYVVGVGVGPVRYRISKMMIARIASWANAISVRDEESRRVLVNAGVDSERVRVACDLALVLGDEEAAKSYVHAPPPKSASRRFGVHLESIFNRAPEEAMAIWEVLLEMAGANTTLVVISDHGTAFSIFCRDYLSRKTCIRTHVEIIEFQGIAQLLQTIASCDGILTSKLHVGIVAYALGVPPFSLWTHQKVPRFYKQIGRAEFCREYQDWRVALARWKDALQSCNHSDILDADRFRWADLAKAELDRLVQSLQNEFVK